MATPALVRLNAVVKFDEYDFVFDFLWWVQVCLCVFVSCVCQGSVGTRALLISVLVNGPVERLHCTLTRACEVLQC